MASKDAFPEFLTFFNGISYDFTESMIDTQW